MLLVLSCAEPRGGGGRCLVLPEKARRAQKSQVGAWALEGPGIAIHTVSSLDTILASRSFNTYAALGEARMGAQGAAARVDRRSNVSVCYCRLSM